MIPALGAAAGGLSAGGSMPISAGGGSAGPSEANATNSIGGIRNAAINFGGGAMQNITNNLPIIAIVIVAGIWAVKR
ncbi:hypothetical protein [Vibrio tasmaniensis]|uniref:hypothetical protein n=1 Tax=Vibrio tasmaniensis TaxID=212663 RepID=UPI00107FB0F8|nr:hypothetical protein [Vibrio tasmaniensis]